MVYTMKSILSALLTFFFLVFPACSCGGRLIDTTTETNFPTPYHRAYFYANIQTKTDKWNTDDTDISQVDKSRKLIAFTFDDAPTSHTERLVAIFAAYNEKHPDCPAGGTLFFNGIRLAPQDKTLLSAALTVGFELGNHTHSHFDLTTLSKDQLLKEIQSVDDYLQTVDGKPRHLLRAPYGKLNDTVKAVACAPIIDWTIDTLDWQNRSADDIYNTVLNGVFDGAIVLMHDGYPETHKAVKRLLPDLKQAGYQVVSVSQLAKANGCVLETGGVYIRARKQK